MSHNTQSKILFRFFQITTITVVAYILIAGGLDINAKVKHNQQTALLSTNTATTSFPISGTRVIEPFTFLNLGARAVIVYDIKKQQVLFAQQKDDILPIASITKLMTIYTASKILTPDSQIIITQEDLDLDSSTGLYLNEHWDFKSLAALTLISSSNSGANAIARTAQNQSAVNFITQMNEAAKEIGLQNTFFRNVTGLDLQEHTMSGAESTAQDIANLYTYILQNKPELLAKTSLGSISITSLDGISHTVQNTNQIVHKIPNLVSSKTGTTDRAGENLAIIFKPQENHPVAIVLLGGSYNSRFVDMQKLVDGTMQMLKK